jgi:hypothetical protein
MRVKLGKKKNNKIFKETKKCNMSNQLIFFVLLEIRLIRMREGFRKTDEPN